MSFRKLQIGLLLMLCIGMCISSVEAVKVLDVDYVLAFPGGWRETSDFYAEKYDVLYIELISNGDIDIQIRKDNGFAVKIWNDVSGNIDLSNVFQDSGSYHIFFSNQYEVDVSVVGVLYLNEEVPTTTSTINVTTITTRITNLPTIIPFVITVLLTGIYAVAGALFVISIVVYRRRRNPDFKYLSMIDDAELLPKGWQPYADEEET